MSEDMTPEEIIHALRGVPTKCDFCGKEYSPEWLMPEEAGEWICFHCDKHDLEVQLGQLWDRTETLAAQLSQAREALEGLRDRFCSCTGERGFCTACQISGNGKQERLHREGGK